MTTSTQSGRAIERCEAESEAVVRVRHGAAVLMADDEAFAVTLDALRAVRWRYADADDGRGWRREAEPMYFVWCDRRDQLKFRPGLVGRVVDVLRRRGWSVAVQDERSWTDRHAVTRPSAVEPAVADTLAGTMEGQFRCATPEAEMDWLIALCRAFSTARVVIPAANLESARDYVRRLRKGLAKPVQLARSQWPRRERVLVCTEAAMNGIEGDWDLLLIPDATGIVDRTRVESLSPLVSSATRRYALVRGARPIPRLAQLCLEALTGPVILDEEDNDPGGPIVAWCEAPATALNNRGGATSLTDAAWRNDRLAALARRCRAGDVIGLWELNALLDASADSLDGIDPIHVAILVENRAHADQLAGLLPEATVLSGHGENGKGSIVAPLRLVTQTRASTDRTALDVDIVILGCETDERVIETVGAWSPRAQWIIALTPPPARQRGTGPNDRQEGGTQGDHPDEAREGRR